MSDQKVSIQQHGTLGTITLTRPKALNSLDLDMINAIDRQIEAWQTGSDVKLIALRGEGEKGFCAGGDVKAVRQILMQEGADSAAQFFDREYALYERIATCKIPTIALQHGFVMGGGIGLSGHASFRVAREGARFAMPEKAIGFFTDVAVNQLVKRAPLHQRVAFLLSGQMVNAIEAQKLNLTDMVVHSDKFDQLTLLLDECAQTGDPLATFSTLIKSYEASPEPTPFLDWADTHKTIFETPNLDEVLAALDRAAKADEGAAKMSGDLAKASSSSLQFTFNLIHASKTIANIVDQFDIEGKLAREMIKNPDFAEGVRAVLVDKDNQPRWMQKDVTAISDKFAQIRGL